MRHVVDSPHRFTPMTQLHLLDAKDVAIQFTKHVNRHFRINMLLKNHLLKGYVVSIPRFLGQSPPQGLQMLLLVMVYIHQIQL